MDGLWALEMRAGGEGTDKTKGKWGAKTKMIDKVVPQDSDNLALD